ncbi:MAG: hypothetical protein AAFN41_07560 [Planctomycetota bacterium]
MLTSMKAESTWLNRHHRRIALLVVALLVLPVVAAFVAFAVTQAASSFRIMTLMVVANVATIINVVTYRRLKLRVIEHRGLLCTNCLFPIQGLGDRGRCPECAMPYERDSTIESWKHDLKMKFGDLAE